MGTSYRNPGKIIGFTAQAIIADGACVVIGTADMSVALPAGADPTGGVLGLMKREGGGSCASGDVVDVVTSGIYAGIAAGTITRGDKLAVADTSGGLKTAAPGAGTNDMVVGQAVESAVSGDRFAVLVNPHVMQGA